MQDTRKATDEERAAFWKAQGELLGASFEMTTERAEEPRTFVGWVDPR